MLIGLSTFSHSQKADTEKKTLKIAVPKSEFFKTIKTYDLIVQGDEKWNQLYKNDKTQTYELKVPDKEVQTDILLAKENADIKIIMGSGAFKYGTENSQAFLESNINI
jgi:hypothetical protein